MAVKVLLNGNEFVTSELGILEHLAAFPHPNVIQLMVTSCRCCCSTGRHLADTRPVIDCQHLQDSFQDTSFVYIVMPQARCDLSRIASGLPECHVAGIGVEVRQLQHTHTHTQHSCPTLTHMSAPMFVTLGRQLVRGIKHLHTHKILHRDLKLANVLLGGGCGDKCIKLADFGCDRLQTPPFCSPL